MRCSGTFRKLTLVNLWGAFGPISMAICVREACVTEDPNQNTDLKRSRAGATSDKNRGQTPLKQPVTKGASVRTSANPVVGIGASAGGIEALGLFFDGAPLMPLKARCLGPRCLRATSTIAPPPVICLFS